MKKFLIILLYICSFSLFAMDEQVNGTKCKQKGGCRKLGLVDSVYSNNGDLVHAVYLPAFKMMSIMTVVNSPSQETSKLFDISNKKSFFVHSSSAYSACNIRSLGLTWLPNSILLCAALADTQHPRDEIIISLSKYESGNLSTSITRCCKPEDYFKKVSLWFNRATNILTLEAVVKNKQRGIREKISKSIPVFP